MGKAQRHWVIFSLKFLSVRKAWERGGAESEYFSLNERKGPGFSPLLLLGLYSFPGTLGTLSAKDREGVGGLHPGLHKQGF